MLDLLKLALSQYGQKEIPGDRHNPNIIKYFKEIGHTWVEDDETAWCAAVMNWLLMKCGYEMTGKLNARSFLDLGDVVTEPVVGDIAIFWRVDRASPYGHVGIYINKDDYYIWVLGGNQSNEYKISKYPKYRLLGYRRPKKVDGNFEVNLIV